MQKNIILALTVYLILPCIALSQNTLNVVIQDSVTLDKLVGVNIVLANTTNGSSTDINGTATLLRIPDGTQTFIIGSIGYKKKSLEIHFPLTSAQPFVINLEEKDSEIDEVVITTTRVNSRVEDSPVKVEVLGEDDMGEENSIKPGNVASILGDISGVQIQQTSPVSGNSVVRMQGLDGKYTLLLQDGMPTFGGLSGGLNILQIPPLDLQQIEIIKGPASTLYGGGAISGLINFISKQPSDSSQKLITLNQSTLHETNLNAFLSGSSNGSGYTLFSGMTRQQASDVNADGFSDVPRLFSYQIHPRIFFALDERTRLNIGMTTSYEERTGGDMSALDIQYGPTGYGFPSGYRERTSTTSVAGDANYHHTFNNEEEVSFKGSLRYLNRMSMTGPSEFSGRQWNGYTEVHYLFPEKNYNFLVGGNYLLDEFYNTSYTIIGRMIPAYKRNTIGLFSQYSLNIQDEMNLQTGIRADWNDAYGWFVLPSAAIVIHLDEDFYVRINGGSGYSIPNVLDATDNSNGASYAFSSASSLHPERSIGGTAEWNYKSIINKGTSLYFNQTFFLTSIRNVVITTTSSNTTQLTNAPGSVTSTGIDNYIRLSSFPYEVYLGYTYTLPKKNYDNQQPYLTYTPIHRAAATVVDQLNSHLRVGLEASYTGHQYRDDGTTTKDFLFLAGMIEYKIEPFTLVLNGENLLDFRQTKYEQVILPPFNNPSFAPLWAPVDGRVINLSILLKS